MSNLEYLKYLESIGVIFSAPIPNSGESSFFNLSACEVDMYGKGKIEEFCNVQGISKDEYILWDKSRGIIICSEDSCNNCINSGHQYAPKNWIIKSKEKIKCYSCIEIDNKHNGIPGSHQSKGVVYILSNLYMPSIIKIGKSTRGAKTRAKELNTTGVPGDFKIDFEVACTDCDLLEVLIHDRLEEYRVIKNKEFFKVDLDYAKESLIELHLDIAR